MIKTLVGKGELVNVRHLSAAHATLRRLPVRTRAVRSHQGDSVDSETEGERVAVMVDEILDSSK